MCIMFCDTSYQILLFDCDIYVTRCDIFATLKNLTKQKRACESFVLKRNLRPLLGKLEAWNKKKRLSPLFFTNLGNPHLRVHRYLSKAAAVGVHASRTTPTHQRGQFVHTEQESPYSQIHGAQKKLLYYHTYYPP